LTPDLRRIAHDSLSLIEPPYLKHYRGKFRLWNGVALTASTLPGPGFNFAACLGDVPPLDAILPVAAEFYADIAPSWGILVEGGAGHPIEAELLARGWVVAEDEPAYVMPDITVGATGGYSPDGLTIRPVATEADRLAFERVTGAAFEAPPDFAEQFAPSREYYSDPGIGLFVGSVNGDDLTTSMYYRVGNTACMTGIATLHAHRGKGYGAAMTRHALAVAASRGCPNAALRSGPKSVPLYERLGFRYVCQHRTYVPPTVV